MTDIGKMYIVNSGLKLAMIIRALNSNDTFAVLLVEVNSTTVDRKKSIEFSEQCLISNSSDNERSASRQGTLSCLNCEKILGNAFLERENISYLKPIKIKRIVSHFLILI